jgi:hypothetical protein
MIIMAMAWAAMKNFSLIIHIRVRMNPSMNFALIISPFFSQENNQPLAHNTTMTTLIQLTPPPNSTVTCTKTSSEEPSPYFVETALEWFERCELLRRQERQIPDEPPASPTAAAWAFFRGSTSIHGGTGNPFVDEALQRQLQWKQLPLIEIKDRQGSSRTGKTHTLVSLAAKFVVSTRASLFSHIPANNNAPRMSAQSIRKQQLPQVIILDSELDITFLRLAHAVSSQLMLHPAAPAEDPATTTTDNDNDMTTATINQELIETERDMEDCLSRIHIARVDDDREWIPILEALRHELVKPKEHDLNGNISKDALVGDDEEREDNFPTLLLWDGFLGNTGRNRGLEKEISRQLAMLLQECNIGFICTTTESRHVQVGDLLQDNSGTGAVQRNRHQPKPYVARTIVLERDLRRESQHGFLATVVEANQQIPYSLSSGGVLP